MPRVLPPQWMSRHDMLVWLSIASLASASGLVIWVLFLSVDAAHSQAARGTFDQQGAADCRWRIGR